MTLYKAERLKSKGFKPFLCLSITSYSVHAPCTQSCTLQYLLNLLVYKLMKRTDIKRRPLSDTVLANLEPELKEYRELDGEGLYFRVKPDGKKAWLFRYKKADGKWSWLGIGTYSFNQLKNNPIF
jgi:hypothetical protein